MIRQALEKSLRNELERTISKARVIAESAAREAIGQLCVAETAPGAHLDPAARDLRNKLRAHARALGDEHLAKPENGCDQRTEALVEEIAYEQWHRMIFARFLAENDLLMFDDGSGAPLAITLDEAAELAEELGAGSKWDLASECAAKMLPGVFRPDTLSFKVKFASDKVRGLEELLEGLATETFGASDSLGWIYQFWQKERKDAVNASEVKIGAKELAPVTQLFTENYMVSFLLDNTLGAWYAALKLKGRQFATEQEARAAVSTEEIPLAYLRLVPVKGFGQDLQDSQDLKSNPDNPVNPVEKTPCEWRPASGAFEKWPSLLSEFSMLDPANGSGHFLVATLLMLVPMRMELEGLDERAAIDKVLSENLHGLELDRRYVELAAFAVALEAWRYPNAGGYRKLPRLQIACDGIAPQMPKTDWVRLARKAARRLEGKGEDFFGEEFDKDASLWEAKLAQSMEELWDVFKNAPTLGSLIEPDTLLPLFSQAGYDEVVKVLQEHVATDDADAHEATVAAQGIVAAMDLLKGKYTLVITNVPYLLRRKQDAFLQEFCAQHYSVSKGDLATVFLERCLKFCSTDKMPVPQSDTLVEWASRPFVGTTAIVLPQNWLFLGTYRKLREKLLKNETFSFIVRLGAGGFQTPMWDFNVQLLIMNHIVAGNDDVLYGVDVSAKKEAFEKAELLTSCRMSCVSQHRQVSNPDAKILLDDVASDALLSQNAVALNGMHGGDSLHYRFAFWEVTDFTQWSFFQGTVSSMMFFGGRTNVFWWPNNGRCHRENPAAFVKGEAFWGRPGVAMSMMGKLPATLYTGEKFDISCSPIILKDDTQLAALWCYCSSPEYHENVRKIDQKLNVTNATLAKVPFDLERWQKVAAEKYPHGLPDPFTNDPTQWIFHGHPCANVYWDEGEKVLKIGELRYDATVLHVAVARLLGYKWPSELDEKMELAAEMREVMKRNDALDDLADDDGIVCIPSLNRELPAADRVLAMLEAAYGDEWTGDTLGGLMESCGCEGMTLERWLRDRFFLSHAKLFGNRPFIWQIWDGLRDGFSVLVNYHKFGRKGLESLIYTYLGDWIEQQKRELAAGTEGAEEKLDAALALKGKLEKILEGEKPFDIFVRWKKLCDQPLGWEPDINDGVRLNIRPFCEAGVLRESAKKLNIKWEKDRGKDVDSAPWAKLFHNERINDHHLSLSEKKAARGL